MPNILYYMHKEGLETYSDSIKILILLLCTSIRQYKDNEIRIIVHVYP